MKKRNLWRVLLAAVLTLLVLTSSALAMTSSYGALYSIGQNTVYYDVDAENENGLQKVNYIEYTPNSGISPVIAYGSGLYGKSTITAIVNYLQSNGQEVIAGINADFFDTTTGIPIGLVIQNGTLVSSNVNQYAVGFQADGSAVIGKPASNMTLFGAAGDVTVDCFNKVRSANTVCLMDRNFSRETRISSPGTNLVLERLDDAPVTVSGSIRLKVVSRTETAVSTPIGDDQMVLTVAASGPVGRIPNYQAGDIVTFTVRTESNAWDDVQFAVGGKTLLNNGNIETAGNPTGANPRSAIGVKEDGTVVVYEVDGRQADLSVGLTPEQLAQELKDLGCVNAINLDGGGSSAMVVQLPGDENPTVVNSPSDGYLRACANYILFVNNKKATGIVKGLHIYPAYRYLLPGAQTGFTVKATDSNYYPADVPADITYRVANAMGTVGSTIFTAGQTAGKATISASTAGGASGSQTVYIIARLDSLKVRKEDTTAWLTSLSVLPGQTVQLHAEGTYKNSPVAMNQDSLTWAVSGDIGLVDKTGRFTAGGKVANGEIVITSNGYEQRIPVAVALGAPQTATITTLASFESEIGFSADANSTLSLATDPCAYGKRSLRWEYRLANAISDQITFGPAALPAGAKSLFLMVAGDDSGAGLYANFTDAEGNFLQAAFGPAVSGKDFWQLAAAVPAGAKYFTGLTLQKGTAPAGYLYLDQLLVSTQATSDTEAPAIAFDTLPTGTAENAAVLVAAQVTDNGGAYALADGQIAVSVDGQSVNFTANQNSGMIAFYTPALALGSHRVTITAYDNSGNLARKSAEIKVGASSPAAFADMNSAHWANDYVNFVAAHHLMTGETNAAGTLNFYPARNLTRAEFAVVIARYLQLDTEKAGEAPFADIAKVPAYALPAVKAVYAAGIMLGSQNAAGNLVFLPNSSITRAEVMTVIGRMLPKGYTVRALSFTDSAKIPAWAASYVKTLTSLGIIGGYADGSIAPNNNITRAEFAKILFSLY